MKEEQFRAELEARGATGIEIRSELFDAGFKRGVAAQCRFDGRAVRYAVRQLSELPIEAAFPSLLDAITDRLAA